MTRMLHGLLPNDGEVTGLLALMLLTDARRAARTGREWRADSARRAGSRVVEPRADRRRRRARVARAVEGCGRLVSAAGRDRGRARSSARAPTTPTGRRSSRCTVCSSGCRTIRWCRSTARSPRRWWTVRRRDSSCLAALDADARIAGHYRLDAVRGHLYEKSGNHERAIAHYRAAAERTTSIARAELSPDEGRSTRRSHRSRQLSSWPEAWHSRRSPFTL